MTLPSAPPTSNPAATCASVPGRSRTSHTATPTQIASATLRSIYTYVSVTADTDGQVNGILTDKPIGDDESILVTGFNPSDVLALIGAQTKNAVWLFRYDEADAGFRQIAAAFDNATDDDEKPLATDPIFSKDAVAARFATGFATIGESNHYIGLLPIISTETKKPIGAVAVSIGLRRISSCHVLLHH